EPGVGAVHRRGAHADQQVAVLRRRDRHAADAHHLGRTIVVADRGLHRGTVNVARSRPATSRQRQPRRWALTTPRACMAEYTVVGPTNANPRRRSSADKALDSAVTVGRSASVAAACCARGSWLHSTAARDVPASRSAHVARALAMVATIFARLR